MATCKDCLFKCYTDDVDRVEETCNFFLPTNKYAEVVRCKDCKHYMEYPINKVEKRMCCYVHLLTPHFMLEDGFCSLGERRTDE